MSSSMSGRSNEADQMGPRGCEQRPSEKVVQLGQNNYSWSEQLFLIRTIILGQNNYSVHSVTSDAVSDLFPQLK
jgi:hypothetical protein